jgi:carbonic anhydrase
MLRIRFRDTFRKNNDFGTIKDVDGTLYRATEIQIHTPAEHTVHNADYDMEVQVIHESVSGVMRQQAILSVLFATDPGAQNAAIDEWNILNVPNPKNPRVNEFFQKDFNVWNFL